MSSDFNPIAAEFRDIFIDLGTRHLSVLALPQERSGGFSDTDAEDDLIAGGAFYPDIEGETCHFDLFIRCFDETLSGRFHNAASRAGALIPNRVREVIYELWPSTAFAWWMSAVWHFATIEPDVSLGWSADRPEVCGRPYIRWDDPIASALSTLEAASLVGPGPQHVVTTGEWSVPMSKTEFARRILKKPDARSRDIRAIFGGFEKRHVGPNTWTELRRPRIRR
jgi:hypothetical protein